ncbi:MAG: hypothetical protein GWO41_16115 [candidate division Zixibacteria bacterium]|nr:hypothetical protein [candidate division Zixibacteria bacterium]NIR62601.1 hypothetical protein [candidate division Zixibacteria bacterium]NIS15380.1 hypothetical protein [candidate division Zixibacteria bacterium]NIS47268.1 hypothetical protein [candidate division Zixibacteria bacterium]NIT54217.1 hypothetical protein [candidate division Zixibacteria bacterium]
MRCTILLMILISSVVSQSPAQIEGSDCENPIVINIQGTYDLPVIVDDQTCGRGNDISNSCLDYYDEGGDIVFQINTDIYLTLAVMLYPHGTERTGFYLDTECPFNNEMDSMCLGSQAAFQGVPHGATLFDAEPGTYYLIIDTWPGPECIPSFTLILDDYWISPGVCICPIPIPLPRSEPFNTVYYTAGESNAFDNTCLGEYDEGEDMVYMLDIRHPGTATCQIDPLGEPNSSMHLFLDCTPPGSPDDCIAYSIDSLGEPHSFSVHLNPGAYYLNMDTKEPFGVTAAFLNVEFEPDFLCGDSNNDGSINVSDAVYIVNFVFAGGGPPDPIASGDLNCDHDVNISDAVWIINYVFIVGPIPGDINSDGWPEC